VLTPVISLHLATVTPAAVIGAYLLLRAKGTPFHRLLGKAYMVLMLTTALLSLLIPAAVGPQLLGHFGAIHLLSLLVLYSVPGAYIAAKKRNVPAHKSHMIGVYVGGVLVAGLFTLAPGRYLHQLLFS
jgi:uncharacterized membrane protein